MITFLISISVLLLGYSIYSQYIERVFGADSQRKTPAITMADGVDYISLPWWRVFLIQFLNIAGLGPIFGAIAGAMWGPVAYIWIVFGAIFAGAVHDYFSGMLSIKHKGLSITEIVGIYMGKFTKQFMRAFTVFLMVMVGTVFILGPAKILSGMTTGYASMTFWIVVVFAYYVIATMLPVDKIIGRIYPVFGVALLFMAVGLIVALIWQGFQIPELTLDTMRNSHNDSENFPFFQCFLLPSPAGQSQDFMLPSHH